MSSYSCAAACGAIQYKISINRNAIHIGGNSLADNMKYKEQISLYQSDSPIMNDAIDRIIIKLYAYKEQYQKNTILLSGCGSSNGTTTIAINLAIALAGAGWNTLLVDADMRKSVEYKRLSDSVSRLSDCLEGNSEIVDVICPTNQAKLHYVPGGVIKTNAVRLLCSENMQNFVKTTSEKYDFVVFDCPSLTIVPDATVLFPFVDCIALVLALDITTKKQLAKAKLEVEKYADKYAGLIVNRADKHRYVRAFPQYNYFEESNMRKSHKRLLRNKADGKGE